MDDVDLQRSRLPADEDGIPDGDGPDRLHPFADLREELQTGVDVIRYGFHLLLQFSALLGILGSNRAFPVRDPSRQNEGEKRTEEQTDRGLRSRRRKLI